MQKLFRQNKREMYGRFIITLLIKKDVLYIYLGHLRNIATHYIA